MRAPGHDALLTVDVQSRTQAALRALRSDLLAADALLAT